MKKDTWLIKAVPLIFIVGIYAGFAQDKGKEKVFKTKNYQIEFTFPSNWRLSDVENPYDLQCTNGNCYISVFGFTRDDLAQNRTPLDIFKAQAKDIMSKRTNVKKLEELKTSNNSHSTVYSELYSAEKNGLKNYYYCNLVEFKDEPKDFAWVLCTAIPSYAKKNIELFDKIMASARQSSK